MNRQEAQTDRSGTKDVDPCKRRVLHLLLNREWTGEANNG